jgi:hypothetical protein
MRRWKRFSLRVETLGVYTAYYYYGVRITLFVNTLLKYFAFLILDHLMDVYVVLPVLVYRHYFVSSRGILVQCISSLTRLWRGDIRRYTSCEDGNATR